jgi:hypothetical protein
VSVCARESGWWARVGCMKQENEKERERACGWMEVEGGLCSEENGLMHTPHTTQQNTNSFNAFVPSRSNLIASSLERATATCRAVRPSFSVECTLCREVCASVSTDNGLLTQQTDRETGKHTDTHAKQTHMPNTARAHRETHERTHLLGFPWRYFFTSSRSPATTKVHRRLENLLFSFTSAILSEQYDASTRPYARRVVVRASVWGCQQRGSEWGDGWSENADALPQRDFVTLEI